MAKTLGEEDLCGDEVLVVLRGRVVVTARCILTCLHDYYFFRMNMCKVLVNNGRICKVSTASF